MLKLSYIISAYNAEKYIEEAIASCFRSGDGSAVDIEVVVVDDGSSDNTWAILENLSEEFPKLLCHQFPRNRGKVSGYNKAFDLAKGDWVLIMAADDIATQHRVKDLTAHSDDYDFVVGGMEFVDEQLHTMNEISFPNIRMFKYVDYTTVISGGVMSGRKEILDDIFPIPAELNFEDWWISYHIIKSRCRIHVSENVFLKYRWHNANALGGSREQISNLKRHFAYHEKFGEFSSKHRAISLLKKSIINGDKSFRGLYFRLLGDRYFYIMFLGSFYPGFMKMLVSAKNILRMK